MIKKTRPVFIFKLVLSFVFFICSPLSASDDRVNLSSKFWEQNAETTFNREYPEGITPRAIILNKMTSSVYPMGDSYGVENETGYVALYHEFDPKFVNSSFFNDLITQQVMGYRSIEHDFILKAMPENRVSEALIGLSFARLYSKLATQLNEIGLTYRSAAKTKLISFGDLGEIAIERYEFSQQGGGRIRWQTGK